MDERFEREGEILNAVFKKEMTTLKGIIGLVEIGISRSEAGQLAYRSARLGRDRRAAAKEKRQ
jgi:hypothetical protein